MGKGKKNTLRNKNKYLLYDYSGNRYKSVTNLYIQCFVELHIYKMIFCLLIKIAQQFASRYVEIGLDSRITYRCS